MMDWLRLEQRIRQILRQCNSCSISFHEAIFMIDDIIGEETGRGYEIDQRFKESKPT